MLIKEVGKINYGGIIIGIISLLTIGVWHRVVVLGEYYLGKKICTVIFCLIGLACIIISLFLENTLLNVGIAFFGFVALWGIKEVRHQEKRVKRGWFPENPSRKK